MITVAEEKLVERLQDVRRILRPLRNQDVSCKFYTHPATRVIAAHDGAPDNSHFREWRFRTFVDELWCSYNENWTPRAVGSKYSLSSANLTLFQLQRETRSLKELLGVHCEPACEDVGKRGLHKKGPHLHVSDSGDPLPRCHFPLNLKDVDIVSTNVQRLTRAMHDATEMLREEVLLRW